MLPWQPIPPFEPVSILSCLHLSRVYTSAQHHQTQHSTAHAQEWTHQQLPLYRSPLGRHINLLHTVDEVASCHLHLQPLKLLAGLGWDGGRASIT